MEAPALMAAQTVPTSARYIDKLTTVGIRSAGRRTRKIQLFRVTQTPRPRPRTATTPESALEGERAKKKDLCVWKGAIRDGRFHGDGGQKQ